MLYKQKLLSIKWPIFLLSLILIASYFVLLAKPTLADEMITNTTTLTEDINSPVTIGADNITLDCAGHKIIGAENDYAKNGIYLENRTGVTIKNCDIEKFEKGIDVENSNNNTFTKNNISLNEEGIYFICSNNNTVLENNIFSNIVGLYINNDCLASDNLIYHNNFKNVWQEGPFKDTWKQAFVNKYHYDLFDKGYPEGGNYWSDYTGEDANKDGIGDTSYTFSNSSEDRYPFMEENGWKKEKTPEWRKNILPGDILYDPFASGVGHVGLYTGNNRVVEALGVPPWKSGYPGKIEDDPITDWDYSERSTVYLLRVKKLNDLSEAEWEEKINGAINFAKKQQSPVAKPYDWHWYQKHYDINSSSWYCSELVWAAYFNQGIDLEYKTSGTEVNFSDPVSPAEIFDDDDTEVVSSHLEGIDKIPWYKSFAPLFIFSPVNVTITDKNGRVLNQAKGTNDIPGATFIEDQTNASGHKYSVIYLPVKYGPYKIQVVRKSVIPQGENTYSLKTKTDKGDIWLAKDHKLPAENKEDDYELNPVALSDNNNSKNAEWGFSDTEKSSGNNFKASTLNFSIPAGNNFSPKVSPTKETTRSVSISKENGSENFKYRVSAKNFTGDDDLCDNLEINDGIDDKYQDLKTYVSSDTDNSTKTEWDFTVRLKDKNSKFIEKTCHFDLVFNSWQENMSYGAGGFTDTETVANTIESDKWINPGDVIINEVMWMGSTVNSNDEWIELRNMTNHNIEISQWEIENAKSSHGTYTIPTNNSISANGYFLIARKDSPDTALNVTPDITGAKLSLANSGNGSLILKTNNDKVIDSAPTTWTAGHTDGTSSGLHESMERNDTPGDGTLAISWHTCISGDANGGTYWKTANGNNFGTPGAANLSPIVMNEILTHPSKDGNQQVELYNLLDKDYDVAGWYFKNSKGDKVIISKDNTNSKKTIIPGKELLVVNLGKDFLDKSNDTLAFYNDKGTPDDDIDDVEEDVYQYENSTKEAGNSFARIPDGTGIWVDPKATLGKKNELDEKELAGFQKLTLNQCFDKKGELINDNKKKVCEPIFLQYLGMLKEINSQKVSAKLVKEIKEKVTQEQKEKENPEKIKDLLKISTKKVSSLSQSKNAPNDSLSANENSQDKADKTMDKAVTGTKKAEDNLEVTKKDTKEKVEETKKNEGKPADENVKPKEAEKKDEEVKK